MTDNMRIWDKVERTDPSFTKKGKVGGQEIFTISGQYMIRRATETFGPLGIGWGFDIIEERFDQGPEIFGGEGGKTVIGREIAHTVRICLWYILDGQKGEVQGYGCTPFSYRSKYGVTTDGEAPKKSLTDSIKKCLSFLGFSADIFLGMFDDPDYLESVKEEEALEKAEDRIAEEERQKQERLEYIKTVLESMQAATTSADLKKIHDAAVRRLGARRDENGIKRIAREWAELSAKLEQMEAPQ